MSNSTDNQRPSFVLLLAKWKPFEIDTLNGAIIRAFGASQDLDSQFALPVIDSAQYMVKIRSSILMIHTIPSPYFNDADAVAMSIESDHQLAAAVRVHSGWLSVDVIGSDDSEDDQYDTIGLLLAELAPADGTAVALFVPDEGVLIRFDQTRRAQLRGPNTLSLLGFEA